VVRRWRRVPRSRRPIDVGELKKQIVALVRDTDPQPNELAIEWASFEIDSEVLRTEEIAKGIVYIINRFRTSEDAASGLRRTSRSFSKLAEQAVKAIEGLKGIISRGDFGVVFQAILDAETGDIHHYEALARFPASNNLRSPAEHIALAEEIELVSEFDFGMMCKVAGRANPRQRGPDRGQRLRPVGEFCRLRRGSRPLARRKLMAAGPSDVRDHGIQPDG
jgi:hypothetical protein